MFDIFTLTAILVCVAVIVQATHFMFKAIPKFRETRRMRTTQKDFDSFFTARIPEKEQDRIRKRFGI